MFAKGQQYKILKEDCWGGIPAGVVVDIIRSGYDEDHGWDGDFVYDGKEYFITVDDVNDGLAIAVKDSYLANTIIILNAPPAAGKNTVADALCEATGAFHSEFKDHLYLCTAVLFNVPVETVRALATDRDTKEVPNKLFGVKLEQYNHLLTEIGEQCNWDLPDTVSLSPRQALIYTSECVFKPAMGNDYFGKIASNNIDMNRGAVFSDGGFDEEMLPLIKQHKAKNIFVVQFTGQGVTGFEGDSRNWLTIPEGVATLKTTNNGTIEEIRNEILDWIKYEREVQQETFK